MSLLKDPTLHHQTPVSSTALTQRSMAVMAHAQFTSFQFGPSLLLSPVLKDRTVKVWHLRVMAVMLTHHTSGTKESGSLVRDQPVACWMQTHSAACINGMHMNGSLHTGTPQPAYSAQAVAQCAASGWNMGGHSAVRFWDVSFKQRFASATSHGVERVLGSCDTPPSGPSVDLSVPISFPLNAVHLLGTKAAHVAFSTPTVADLTRLSMVDQSPQNMQTGTRE
jgi:hypothetical protein